MHNLLTPIKYFLLAIITIGTIFALSDPYMYLGAALAISAGITLNEIEYAEDVYEY